MAGEKTGGWHQDEEKGGIREEEAAATGREDGEAGWRTALETRCGSSTELIDN